MGIHWPWSEVTEKYTDIVLTMWMTLTSMAFMDPIGPLSSEVKLGKEGVKLELDDGPNGRVQVCTCCMHTMHSSSWSPFSIVYAYAYVYPQPCLQDKSTCVSPRTTGWQ